MYIIRHDIDERDIATFERPAELINFVRNVAVANGDEELSITTFGEATDYVDNYCRSWSVQYIKRIKSCGECPFAVPDGEPESNQHICSEIARQRITWIGDIGFDDFYHTAEYGIPKACPLRKIPVTICLGK